MKGQIVKVFTTGQVAKICKVAPRNVSKWFDSGRLKGYRIPGSQDRRIPYEYLKNFLIQYGMNDELAALEGAYADKVLILSQDEDLIGSLVNSLEVGTNPHFKKPKLYIARTELEASAFVDQHSPRIVVVDFCIGVDDAETWTLDTSRKGIAYLVIYPEHFSTGNIRGRNLRMIIDELHILKKPVDLAQVGTVVSTIFQKT